MKVRELMRFSRKYLRGRRTAVLMVCMLPIGAGLIFRLAEAAIYSMLLYYGEMKPMDILNGSSRNTACIMDVIYTCPLSCMRTAVLCDGSQIK